MELYGIVMFFFLALAKLVVANPCDGVGAQPVFYHEYLGDACPPPFPLNPDGSCSQWANYAYDCISYCQINTTFDWATESPFPRSECHYPTECSISESSSTSWSWSFGFSPKVGKAVKLGISGGYSQSYGTSQGRSWSFKPNHGECGYFTFVPARKTTCGTLSQSTPMWQDGMWTCAPNVVNTNDFCAPQVWYDATGQPDGVVLFVRINCLTREPLGPEFQDPIYNMPGVPMDRGMLATIMQSWVVDTCSASLVSNNADGTQTASFEIHGKGFSDTQLGDNGANLNAGITSCGTLASWAFNWTPDNGTYDWSATATVTGKSFKGCVGDAVVAAGGSTKDGCDEGPLSPRVSNLPLHTGLRWYSRLKSSLLLVQVKASKVTFNISHSTLFSHYKQPWKSSRRFTWRSTLTMTRTGISNSQIPNIGIRLSLSQQFPGQQKEQSSETELEADSLVGFMASPSPVDQNAQPLPRFQLISIEIGEYYRVGIDSQIFKGLLAAASISAEGLWLLVQDKMGIHSTCRSGVYETHYFGHAQWNMAWSFDLRRLCTKVLYISFNKGYKEIIPLLERFKDDIPSPLLLGYIYCLNSSQFELGNKLYYEIEMKIGYWYHEDTASRFSKPSRLDLSDLSRLLDELEGQAQAASLEEVVSDSFKRKMHSTTLRLSRAFPAVRSRLMARESQIQRDKQRGVELSNLLFVLLTHEDAVKGADMAKLDAEIAAASKRDSASMKTVAVLTMAFLPATFFAALFAIPSLDWKGAAEAGGSVIQSNFWVYWAFTLPATVLVFIVWLVLNNRTWLVEVYNE
ncbi:hypothetical protein PG996_003818 [Apiospora saccharicola]|uniref:Uncharacterized protein n=1 Tax=Apiospora saccharicola TaxID=335842 RepID=A0ABR1W2G5_9PEZI